MNKQFEKFLPEFEVYIRERTKHTVDITLTRHKDNKLTVEKFWLSSDDEIKDEYLVGYIENKIWKHTQEVMDNDLIVLCKDCHKKEHGLIDEGK